MLPVSDGKLFKTIFAEIKQVFLAVGLFSLVINLLMLVGPFYMLQVYDRVLASGSIPTLIFLTIAAVGLTMAGSVLEWLRGRLLIRMNGRLETRLRQPLFYGVFAAKKDASPHTAQPIKDLEAVRGFLSGSGLTTLFDMPWTPIFLAIIFVFHPILGLIATSGAILLFVLTVIGEFATRKMVLAGSSQSTSAARFAENALQNREVVQAMGMLPGLYDRWNTRYEQAHAYQAAAGDRSGILTAIAKFIRPILQIAMLGSGAYLVLNQMASPGVMIAGSIIMGRALAPVQSAIGSWKSFVLARAAYGRVKTFFEETPDDKLQSELPKPLGNLLIEKAVAAPPSAKVPVLKGISFRVSAGESIGVIGPSASGKSTLARMLVGVWHPTSGSVRLDGVDITKWDPRELGPNIGYLPQDIELFDGTVSENICRFGSPDPEGVLAVANLAGVHQLILQLDNGYDTPIGPGGNSLSGGQKQRIALARALYHLPALVVLDEPNSNLDAEGEEALRTALGHLKKHGTTVIVIAHRPSILQTVDKILFLKNGMIDNFGTREDVLGQVTRPVDVATKQQKKPAPVKEIA